MLGRRALSIPLLAAGSLLSACSTGGEEERPQSTVKLDADHYLFGLVARAVFPAFPTTDGDLTTVDGRLQLMADGNYRLETSTGSLLSESAYFLEADGTFSIQVPTATQTLLYRGGYGLSHDTGDVFLTDRIGTGIGLYIGCERVTGAADLGSMVGDWHVFTMHALMAQGSPSPDPDLVAHSFGGTLTLAADGSFNGTGTASDAQSEAVRGIANDFQAFADGRFVVEMTYDPSGLPDYERGFQCGGTPRVLFGVDPDSGPNDPAAGLLAMIRHRTSSYAAADLAGTYHFALWTMFPTPSASGSQAAIGTLELTRDGDFLIQARDAGIPGVRDPADFDYRGTWTATQLGALTLQVTDTGETWVGAFDDLYETVVLLDPVMRSSSSLVELNFGIGIRPDETPP